MYFPNSCALDVAELYTKSPWVLCALLPGAHNSWLIIEQNTLKYSLSVADLGGGGFLGLQPPLLERNFF